MVHFQAGGTVLAQSSSSLISVALAAEKKCNDVCLYSSFKKEKKNSEATQLKCWSTGEPLTTTTPS